MSFDYSELATMADGILADLGRTVVLRKQAQSFNSRTGANAIAASDTNVACVTTTYRGREIDGSRIKAGDVKAIITAVAGVEPVKGDLLVIDGLSWSIVWVDKAKPAATVLVYIAQLRRG